MAETAKSWLGSRQPGPAMPDAPTYICISFNLFLFFFNLGR